MKFYRYETTQRIANFGEECYTIGNVIYWYNLQMYCIEFDLVKETPKGYFIKASGPDWLEAESIWVSKTSKKRYAYPTKEQALEYFVHRKEKRIKILSQYIDTCQEAILLAGQELTKLNQHD